jgi:hypothetical protein
MKDQKLLIGIIVAVGIGVAYHLRNMRKKADLAKANDLKTLEKEVIEENSIVYRNPVKAQYDIVLPQSQVSKKVAEKAKKLTEGRFDIILDRVKQPMYI